MRIIFVRHGEPDYTKDCLTENGIAQAEAVAKRLTKEPIAKIYSSPMGRTMETAGYTADALGIGREEIVVLDYMHELIWGSKDKEQIYEDGHPWTIANEMVEKGVDLTDTSWPDNPYFINNRVTECTFRTADGIDNLIKELGYIREGLYYRNVRTDKEERTVALFSHGGSSTAAIGHILNLTFPYLCATLHSPFTGIVILRFDARPGSISIPCLEYVD